MYLEPILEQMEDVKLLSKPSKDKYLTNFCVFPEKEYLKAEVMACKVFFEKNFPEKVSSIIMGLEDRLRALDFYGNDFDAKYLMWLGYVAAGDIIGIRGREAYVRKYKDKYPDEAERSYRITMEYKMPEEKIEDSEYEGLKTMGWSNLHQRFETAQYGMVEYVNNFETSPFPAGEGMISGRDNWVDGNNISLLLALSENPGLQLNAHEQEKVEEILLPYVRKDLMSNFIHWDMRMFFQPTTYLFHYGHNESDYLAKPEDYSHSAAGLMIVKWEGYK